MFATDTTGFNNINVSFDWYSTEMVNASTGADDVSTQGTALNNNSGNWRFDNIVISGTAVPEPASLAVVGLGLASLAHCGRRNRKT